MSFIPRRRYVFFPGEIAEICRRRHWSKPALDPGAVAAFEAALADYHDVRHARATHSGRDALIFLLDACGLRPGDEIIIPAYTFRALIELIAEHGYVPVPVDIGARNFNLDPQAVRQRITPATRAILATHLFGQPCALDALKDIAEQHGLLLIEDCAQAMGSDWRGQKLGSIGDAAILSFDLLKPINSIGGGAILTSRDDIAQRLAERLPSTPPLRRALGKRIALALAEHGVLRSPLARLFALALAHPLSQQWITATYRKMQRQARPAPAAYTSLQATLALRLMNSLDGRIAVRRALMRRLSALLGEIPAAAIGSGENGYFFVRLVDGDACKLRRDLLRAGIDAGIGAEVADYCGDLGQAIECPQARRAARQAIQLPLYEGLSDAELQRIARPCQGRLVLQR